MNDFEKVNLLGVGFTSGKEDEILEFITKGLENETEKYYIVTPNPELLVIASRDKAYKTILNGAKLALPDGIGVILASKLLGGSLKQRITGVDLVDNLCRKVSKRPVMVGFLGSKPGIADLTAECLRKKYPELKVGLTSEEWTEDLKGKRVDILFVAFGSPKQEIWIKDNLHKLPVRVAVGVGGAFDLISGKTPRAPKLLQRLGLEWLFRLVIQPRRIKRQLSLIVFILLVLKEKLRIS